jgi:hypothetical protein
MVKQQFKSLTKQLLLGVVRSLPRQSFDKFVYRFASKIRSKGKMGFYNERLVNYLNREIIIDELKKKGVWCKSVGGNQFDIFEYLLENKVVQPLDYLEFGVYRGESINWWLNKLGSDSNLYGFDSFEGLNEDWYFGCPKGTFHVGSEPSIVAPNIRFVKGWFEDSLVPFLSTVKLKENLVLHLDADLYIPTIFVFRTLKELLIPGTIVIFDEFWFVKDEYKALLDFISETGKTFEYIAVTDRNVAVKFTS